MLSASLNKTFPSFLHSECFDSSARCSSVVEHLLMVRWFVGSILRGGPIKLFLVVASATLLVKQRSLYVLSCLHSECLYSCALRDCILLQSGCSSEVECSLMVRWVIGSILHGVDPLSYFSFQPVLHDWCNKSHGMVCAILCGMVHIKEPLLLIGKSSSLSEWSLTICHITVDKMC